MQFVENKVSKNIGVLYKAILVLSKYGRKSLYFNVLIKLWEYRWEKYKTKKKKNFKKLSSKQKQAVAVIISIKVLNTNNNLKD